MFCRFVDDLVCFLLGLLFNFVSLSRWYFAKNVFALLHDKLTVSSLRCCRLKSPRQTRDMTLRLNNAWEGTTQVIDAAEFMASNGDELGASAELVAEAELILEKRASLSMPWSTLPSIQTASDETLAPLLEASAAIATGNTGKEPLSHPSLSQPQFLAGLSSILELISQLSKSAAATATGSSSPSSTVPPGLLPSLKLLRRVFACVSKVSVSSGSLDGLLSDSQSGVAYVLGAVLVLCRSGQVPYKSIFMTATNAAALQLPKTNDALWELLWPSAFHEQDVLTGPTALAALHTLSVDSPSRLRAIWTHSTFTGALIDASRVEEADQNLQWIIPSLKKFLALDALASTLEVVQEGSLGVLFGLIEAVVGPGESSSATLGSESYMALFVNHWMTIPPTDTVPYSTLACLLGAEAVHVSRGVKDRLVEADGVGWLVKSIADMPTVSNPNDPAYGLKSDLMRVLCNLSWRHTSVQNAVEATGGIEVALSSTAVDDGNPMLREWALFAIRNLCEDNPKVQAHVESLKIQDVAPTPELEELGLKATVRNGKITVSKKGGGKGSNT